MKVCEIASHAFESDTAMQEVILPEGLQSVGRFAFLNCINLKVLELTDSVQSFADTALRQCDSLSLIRVHINHDDPRVLSQLLAAVEKEITLELLYPDEKAVLLFPDYRYVYTEHTMSRAFLFNIDGCGMAYRECVDFNGVNFREYDKLFEKERQTDPHAAPFLALNRLMHPYRLSPVSKKMYEAYFKNDLYLPETCNSSNSNLSSEDSAQNITCSLLPFEQQPTTPHSSYSQPQTYSTVPVTSLHQDSDTAFSAGSYAAGDGVFLLSAENRDERPDFLRELLLRYDIDKLRFLTDQKLLSQNTAMRLLTYTDSVRTDTAPAANDRYHSSFAKGTTASTGQAAHIRALLMDYLHEKKQGSPIPERFSL